MKRLGEYEKMLFYSGPFGTDYHFKWYFLPQSSIQANAPGHLTYFNAPNNQLESKSFLCRESLFQDKHNYCLHSKVFILSP